MELKIKAVSPKIGKEIPTPFYATPGSAAMDLHACLDQPITLLPGGRTVIPTGIAIALPSAGYVALVLALKKMQQAGQLREWPVSSPVAAVSAGIVGDEPMLDLCYEEDSSAQVDLNCVMDGQGRLIEIQGTGEGRPFTLEEQQKLVELCAKGIQELQAIQRAVLE